MLPLSELSLALNMAILALSAIVVWFAGSRLSVYADTISNATGMGQAAIGIILLAGVTSLPEIGVTAAVLGVVLTSLFLVGLAERRDRTFLRMGYDSIAVIFAYAGGIMLLYTLRDAA